MNLNWTNFKSFLTTFDPLYYKIDQDEHYYVFAWMRDLQVRCTLEKVSADGQDFMNNYMAGCVSNHDPAISQTLSIPVVAVRKEERDFSTIISHNWCDNATWPLPGDSSWSITPSSGYMTVLSRSEIQFKTDLDLTNSTVFFDYYAWIGGGQTAVVQQLVFDKIEKIFELGNAHYESTAFGFTTVQFNHEYQLVLHSKEIPGTLSHVVAYTLNHTQIAGSYVTASFVTESRPE